MKDYLEDVRRRWKQITGSGAVRHAEHEDEGGLADTGDKGAGDKGAEGAMAGVPVLGSIPHDPTVIRHPMVTALDDDAPRAEAFRRLGTKLRSLDTADCKVLSVTCPAAEKGKTTTATNLAIVLARAGLKVLLLEADLRHPPRIARTMQLDEGTGLATLLADRSRLSELGLEEFVLDPGVPNLSVLPSGPRPPQQAQLLRSEGLVEVLDQAWSLYDVVIVDTPPLLTVPYAAPLAAECDAALLVTQYGKTTEQQLRQAAERLEALGGRVIGAVLNMSPEQRVEGPGSAGDRGDSRDGSADGKPRRAALLAGALAGLLAVGLLTVVGFRLAAGPAEPAEPSDQAPVEASASEPSSATGDDGPALSAAECRAAYTAQKPPLKAAARSLELWEVHVDAMNQLVNGEITLAQAQDFWDRTRIGAEKRLADYRSAEETYDGTSPACPADSGGSPLPGEARFCPDAVAARADALQAADAALRTWAEHVRHMEMLRSGHMTADEATQLWLESWRAGVRELDAYHAAVQEARGRRC